MKMLHGVLTAICLLVVVVRAGFSFLCLSGTCGLDMVIQFAEWAWALSMLLHADHWRTSQMPCYSACVLAGW